MPDQTPLNPKALREGAAAIVEFQHQGSPWKAPWGDMGEPTRAYISKQFAVGVSAYLTAAQSVARCKERHSPDLVCDGCEPPAPAPSVVNSVDGLPDNTVIEDNVGDVGIIFNGHIWYPETNPLSIERVAKRYGPFTIRYRPEVNSVEELVTTPAGRALANASFNEGLSAGIRACNESLEGEPFVKPVSPYRPEAKP
ncbi:hypothetical protein [Glutamicibacter ardleyensis]|uniref:DUF1738 domain-containing protein n=1 Tax=Glutamicibacter ardleyensis TaxID=225894 RepID=A0ABQ2DV58_9MICC|nr:hypothetical protein [Glutamicibacter ardleyensis]GGJ74481.1 hypothetical protein GCM10007173_36830 [Glutamicibacter ardleyensis]